MSKKLTDLTALTNLSQSDLIHVVDVSDISQDSAGSSKKVTLLSLLSLISSVAWVTDYTPVEAVNGSNAVFTLPVNASQVSVYADGYRVKGNGLDYTFSSNDTITFVAGRQPFSAISIDYLPN